MLAYTSVDGGATWRTTQPFGPANGRCDYGDPAPAIAADGRQLLASVVGPCYVTERLDVALELSSRAGPDDAWTNVEVAPGDEFLNDKPALAVDTGAASVHRGRLYLAWTRIGANFAAPIVLAHSDDGGTSWSPATPIMKPALGDPGQTFASLAVDPAGGVYVAWADQFRELHVAYSVDGGDTFGASVRVATATGPNVSADCGGFPIPAQPRRCVTPTPLVVAAGDRIVVTYAAGRRQLDVYAARLAPLLQRRLGIVRVNPPDRRYRSDQFLPASAYDSSTGLLWVCFYDTRLDRRRVRARYSCAASRDGGSTWARPLAVASVASDETRLPAEVGFGFGDYEGLAVAAGVAHPIWTDGRDLRRRREEIYTTALTAAELASR